MKLPETWSTNEKMFASGGQGHGFAAERGNHIVDRVRLKNGKRKLTAVCSHQTRIGNLDAHLI
ncbi:hypothetical protein DEO08_26520 [Escherichia coli]|nr:hypothetical protein DEO08_26520 [Escherichia coli]